MRKFFFSLLFLVGAICAVCSVICAVHADTSSRKPLVDVPAFVENPYMYTYGVIKYGEVFEYKRGIFTAIQVHPMPETGTAMYDTQITFCGNQSAKLSKIVNQHLVVITYSKLIHPELCQDLVSVDMVDKL